MSAGQRALWFEQCVRPDSNAYNLATCVRFTQAIDCVRLDRALATLADRHPLLRARFDLVNEAPCWYVSSQPLLCSVTASQTRIAEIVLRPYVLADEHPFRFAIAAIDGATLLGIGCHHIVADLHSLQILLRDLDDAYSAGGNGPLAQAPAAGSYADFCAWQDDMTRSGRGRSSAAFWSRRLGSGAAAMGPQFPAPMVGATVQAAARINFGIAAQQIDALTAIARNAAATPYVALLTTFQVLLAHRHRRATVVAGTPVSGRNHARFHETVGYFVNLLPMVLDVNAGESFGCAVARNGAMVRSALRHGQYPFASMVEQCALARTDTGSAVVQATFTFQNTASGLPDHLTLLALGLPGGAMRLAGELGQMVPLPEPQPQFPFGITLAPTANGVEGSLQYDPARIRQDDAELFLQDWLALIALCAEHSGTEMRSMLCQLSAPQQILEQSLSAAIEAAIIGHADRPAIAGPHGELSYRQLGERSGALAAKLHAMGIGRGGRVAVVGDGSPDTIVALLGVLRSGAAFVPIDCDTGIDQIASLLRAARVSALVHCSDLPLALPDHPDIPQLSARQDRFGAAMPAPRCEALDPAWLMFTSGTTGVPKAAVVPHEAALAHARAIAERFDLRPADRVLQFASLSFDEHAEEIFPTLLAGACVVCMPRIRFQDPERLLQEVRAARISVLHLPTSYWHVWVDEMAHHVLPVPDTLRLVNAGGEQASLSRLRIWSHKVSPQVRWFNSYGLTEAAVTSLVYELPPDREALQSLACVPVGRPLAGTLFRIDAAQGDSGELLLGGAGIGLGYFDRPAAGTAFFTEAGEHGPVRWLRTGDMARFNADADVEIIDRRDRSIKLRGMRVALPELEAALARHPALKECVASAVDDDGRSDTRIALHVVLQAELVVTEAQLLDFLSQEMPAAPAALTVHFHPAIARTAGRKPDYAKLRAAQPAPQVAIEHVDESDELSARVSAIFTRHLQREQLAPTADFFAMGGHSLMAMRIVGALRRELGVDFAISDFLASPTINGVLGLCRNRVAAPTRHGAGISVGSGGQYRLSHAQKRALTLEAAAGGTASLALMITGRIDAARIEHAWRVVVTRHGLLSAAISDSGNQEQDAPDVMLQVRHIALTSPETMSRRHLANAARAAFARHADRPPALRATLTVAGEGRHVVFIEARHTAVDGGSAMLLLREFAQACSLDESEPMSPPHSYGQYVAAEAAWMASPAHATAIAYWDRYLEGAGPPTRLPDMTDHHCDDFASRRFGFTVDARLQDRLLALASARRSTPFAVVLAAFIVLVHRYTLSDDILIGVPISLRDVLGMEGVMGPSLNALPFRARVASGDTFSALLQRTQTRLSASLEHAVLPSEQIADLCPVLRDTRGLPIPIQVVAQDDISLHAKDNTICIEQLAERDGHSPVALLVGIRLEPVIRIEFEYQRAIFSAAAAVRIASAMRIVLRDLVQWPDRPLSEARMRKHGALAQALAPRPLASPPGFPTVLHGGVSIGAQQHPGRIAVVWGEQSWTYGQLDNLANRHAQRLLDAGLRPGGHVIVVSQKGIAEVVAVLAILKAGGVYVPVAGDTPPARARAIAMQTNACIVTGMAGLEAVVGADKHATFIAVDLHAGPPAAVVDIVGGDDASAYILFTSGSSGEPKGVEVSHRAALTTIGEMLRRFEIGPGDVFYGFSELGFDLSVFDCFGAFAAGACLVLQFHQARADAFEWMDDVKRHGVTIWNSVPSALDMLLEACGAGQMHSLRRLLASGDWIGLDLPARARRACPGAMFVALGGATEAGIWSNCHVVERVDPAWRSIPYGRALNGQSMFVAEPAGWPAPVGVPGEICIGGDALAKGYWGDPVLTAEKFVAHAQTGARIYRTGDLGRYREDGAIEFLGRRDQQIKLRGHRIDTGDIAAAVSSCPGVRRALIHVTDGDAGLPDTIVAYVLAADEALLDGAQLRRHAETLLPRSMWPRHYCLVESIPLTANGKIDWAALSELAPGFPVTLEHNVANVSEREQLLAGVWNTVLPGRFPGPDDDFFQLGGNSVTAVKLVATVRRQFGTNVSLTQWLADPTLAHMARLIAATSAHALVGLRPVSSATSLRDKVHLASDLVFSLPKSDGTGELLITGGTGLIGSRLIARLLLQSSRDLVCLVRKLDDTHPEGRLSSFIRQSGIPAAQWTSRVRFVVGDLAQRQFGLCDADFTALASRIGSIFHVGAKVNLIAGYDTLEAANVGGTHEAVRLAALAGASMHFVSSVGVLPYGAGTTVTETDSVDTPGTLLTGYCETKWVAEQTVRLAASRGLRTTIYRPGLTIDETAPGEHDMLALLLALTRQVGGLPALDIPVDLTTADYVAAAIVHIAGHPRSEGGTFHLTHPVPELLADLVKRTGMAMPMLPFDVWRAKLEAALHTMTDPRVAALGAMIVGQREADITPARIECCAALALLKASGIVCLPVATIVSMRLRSLQ